MAISKMDNLNEFQKHIVLAIDGYRNRELQGRVYHEVLGAPESFHNIMDMIALIEGIFEKLKYPAPVFSERYFKKMDESLRSRIRLEKESRKEAVTGKIATIKIHITHRHNATWRGEILRVEDDQRESFESFLELLGIVDDMLEHHGAEEIRRQDEGRFNGVMDLMRTLRSQLNTDADNRTSSVVNSCRMVPGQVLKLYRAGEEQTTLLIRILFAENHSWQGTIQWKERNEQASFRSFLELVKLMDINLGDWNTWNDPQEWETEKYYWNYS